MRYQILIAYDGTDYAGWQVQANALTIQPLIQKALETVLRHPLSLSGSGRTDAGVHACGQSAHFDTPNPIGLHTLLLSLNALLPLDIRILEVKPVEDTFHARYSAKSKIYHYHLHLDSISDPFTARYRHQVFGRCSIESMREAAKYFIGTHNFCSFANVKKQLLADSERTIYRLDILEQKGGVRLEFEGNGFLYKMVRNITGTLLDAASGKISPPYIKKILQEEDRKKAGAAAPAKGLFLMEVKY